MNTILIWIVLAAWVGGAAEARNEWCRFRTRNAFELLMSFVIGAFTGAAGGLMVALLVCATVAAVVPR